MLVWLPENGLFQYLQDSVAVFEVRTKKYWTKAKAYGQSLHYSLLIRLPLLITKSAIILVSTQTSPISLNIRPSSSI